MYDNVGVIQNFAPAASFPSHHLKWHPLTSDPVSTPAVEFKLEQFIIA
jgi:hypothetical protein